MSKQDRRPRTPTLNAEEAFALANHNEEKAVAIGFDSSAPNLDDLEVAGEHLRRAKRFTALAEHLTDLALSATAAKAFETETFDGGPAASPE